MTDTKTLSVCPHPECLECSLAAAWPELYAPNIHAPTLTKTRRKTSNKRRPTIRANKRN